MRVANKTKREMVKVRVIKYINLKYPEWSSRIKFPAHKALEGGNLLAVSEPFFGTCIFRAEDFKSLRQGLRSRLEQHGAKCFFEAVGEAAEITSTYIKI